MVGRVVPFWKVKLWREKVWIGGDAMVFEW